MKVNLLFVFLFGSFSCLAQVSNQQVEFVNFSQVNITDHFWKPKIDKVSSVTLKSCIYQTEDKTPRIRNFEKVARNKGERFEGLYYDDSDVYKALEAMAYSLKTNPDPAMEAKADEWIDKIAAAQLPDGYIGTYYTLRDVKSRWTNIEAHEDYNAGHMFEAAVAYYHVTGKRKFLDIASRFADHIDSTFRLGNKRWFSGHQEIELALVKLYKATSNERYLKLADWYLQQRGKGHYTYGKTWFKPDYWQDLVDVKENREITGHAVRAMYLYTGTADVAAITGDRAYLNAMNAVWEDVVHRNMYITGGIGSAGDNEGFSKDYDLPNEDAYCETCASVGMVLWNQRMCQLTGNSKYIDVLERSLYNGALDGLSLDGSKFFYDNVLASNGQHKRKEWFGTACCPANIARLVTSLGNYIYARSDDAIYVNLFIGSNTTIPLAKGKVGVKLESNYPWQGGSKLIIDPVKKMRFKVFIRIPEFMTQSTSQAYTFQNSDSNSFPKMKISVNGGLTDYQLQNGYAVVEREWNKHDSIEFHLPTVPVFISSTASIKYNKDRLAIQRGPLLYCVEGADNDHEVWNIILDPKAVFEEINTTILDENVIVLRTEALSAKPAPDGKTITMEKRKITLMPYYCWANRGPNSMQVWLPTKIREVKINYTSKYEDGGNY